MRGLETSERNLPSAHQTRPGEHGVVNGVGADVARRVGEVHLDHDEVVDVLEIVPDDLLRQPRIAAPDDEVPRCADANLARDVSGQGKLAFGPFNVHLQGYC